VHFDADVFDESEMPAVTYAQPDGLDWGQVEALLRALVSSPALVGLSIADFEPDKDPDGQHVRRIVDLTARLLKQ
jgi:arginase